MPAADEEGTLVKFLCGHHTRGMEMESITIS